MKKIDFHIHTKSTISDNNFNFSMERLKKYIEIAKLDSIAITNHNTFDKNQFEQIKNNVEIKVFPGIEINLERGHILIIAEDEDIDEFESKCQLVENNIKDANDFLNYQEFISIFGDLKKYLVVPHYQKDPCIPIEIIKKLEGYIDAGEVGSSKKWSSLIKELTGITPVIFSDLRVKEELRDDEFPVRQIYIEIDDLTISKIKLVLKDKTKIHISSNNDSESFQILHDGTNASTKLNIILGKRSSGKTHTLDTIFSSYKEQKIKYIKQFELVQNSGNDKFEEIINKQQNETLNEFLKELKEITNKIIDASNYNYCDIDDFLISLKEYAENKEKDDIFSKCKLFTETKFIKKDNSNIKRTIESIISIIEDDENKQIIENYIDLNNVKRLLVKLIEEYRKKEFENDFKEITNKLVDIVKEELGKKSALNPIKDVNFREIAENQCKIKKFDDLVNLVTEEKVFKKEKIFEFEILAKVAPVNQISDFNKRIKFKSSLSEAFKEHRKPYQYLIKLLETGVDKDELHKCFWKIEFKVVNKYGNELSGGEKAEYNLLSEIKDSYKNEILLIDEPESSFDNIFIKKYVIDMIKEISAKTTVFLVTHNNTLGILMSPDCIIYTEHQAEDGKNNFLVYTGKLSSKELKTANGEQIKNYDILLDTMEAGKDAYERRKEIYESIKD